jgi:hypothetical protein
MPDAGGSGGTWTEEPVKFDRDKMASLELEAEIRSGTGLAEASWKPLAMPASDGPDCPGRCGCCICKKERLAQSALLTQQDGCSALRATYNQCPSK